MDKIIKISRYAFVIICIITSLSTLSFRNNVFADTLAMSCESGMCEVHPCNVAASVYIYDADLGCHEIYLDCYACVDFSNSNCTCYGKSMYCWENGVQYYGKPVDCPGR